MVVLASSSPLLAQNYCESWESPRAIGNLGTRGLDETSGMVASRRQEDVIWLHNDSGDAARIFALSSRGKYLGEWTIEGVELDDWEDIAWGPCADGASACLWIADTGNNTLLRDTLRIFRVREPDIDRSKPSAKHVIRDFDLLEFRYPDGERYDAETLMVASDGDFWVVTKGVTEAKIFRGNDPQKEGVIMTLRKTATREGLRLVTGGDMAADESRFVLRGYDWAMVFLLENGESPGDVFEGETITVPLAVEPQGEAIAYTADGKAILTTSEERHQPIFRYECKVFAKPEDVQTVSQVPEAKSSYPESTSTTSKWLGCRAASGRASTGWLFVVLFAAAVARRWRF